VAVHAAWRTGAVGVLTNLGLVAITTTTLKTLLPFTFLGLFEVNESNRTLFFVAIEHLLLLAQFVVVVAIPDTPEDLSVERALLMWRVAAPRQPDPPPPVDGDDNSILAKFGEPILRPRTAGERFEHGEMEC
jgi:hypothetical protein